jgi:uncharacterized protein YndB with AHSA1/START domain/DNA-binding transcriptional ArsR family regulator
MDDASAEPSSTALDDAPVFRALADPTRRRLLDLLLERGGRTVGELAAPFERGPDGQGMTRYGVMKHLRILEDAGLVATRRDGRTTRLYLNPVPIRELSRRWLDRFAETASDSLLDLQHSLEGTVMPEPSATQLYQVFIRATPERIWRAITDPDESKQYFHGARISVDTQRMRSLGPGGDVWGDSAVEVFDPPHKLVYGWSSMYDPAMAAEPTSRVTFEIEEVGDGVCKLTLLHDRLEASPITAESVSGEGWMFVLSNLKSWLETGEALQLAG